VVLEKLQREKLQHPIEPRSTELLRSTVSTAYVNMLKTLKPQLSAKRRALTPGLA